MICLQEFARKYEFIFEFSFILTTILNSCLSTVINLFLAINVTMNPQIESRKQHQNIISYNLIFIFVLISV